MDESTVITYKAEEIEAKLSTLRADQAEWDRLADKYMNYWQLQEQIETYEWLLNG